MLSVEEQQALLVWIQTLDETAASLDTLSDGIILSKVMHDIAPAHIQLDLIHQDVGDNWALKSHNLQLLLRLIDAYYRDELRVVPDVADIDVTAICKKGDDSEMAKLIELVLGCAIQCETKEKYVRGIMELTEDVQASLMNIIQQLTSSMPPISPMATSLANRMSYPSPEKDQSFSRSFSRDDSFDQYSLLQNEKQTLEAQVLTMKSKIEVLEKENVKLKDDIQEHIEREDKDRIRQEEQSIATSMKHGEATKIQQEADLQIREMERKLAERDQELEKVKMETKEKLMLLEGEVRRQADELDISRSKVMQLGKLEATLSKYKAKLEEASMIRQQMKELEAQNAEYLDKILDLESTKSTITSLKETIETYKNKVVDLETTNVEATSKNNVQEQRIARLQEELENQSNGKVFLEEQLEALRSELNLIHHTKNNATMENDDSFHAEMLSNDSESRHNTGEFGASTADLRKQLRILERENKELKQQSKSSADQCTSSAIGDSRTMILENELDDLRRVKERLEKNSAEDKRKLHTYESEIEALKKHIEEGDNSGNAGLKQEMEEKEKKRATLQQANEKMAAEIAKYRDQLESSEHGYKSTVDELTKRIKDRDSSINQLSTDKERLENYLKKTLHAVQTKYMVAMSSNQKEVQEYQEENKMYEKKLKEVRLIHAQEEALMLSALYEVGEEMQRRIMTSKRGADRAMAEQDPRSSTARGAALGAKYPSSWIGKQRNEERNKGK